jgi:signal transduction histidine kinase
LAIVRSIAQRHGGRLQLQSPGEGGGLTAEVILPRLVPILLRQGMSGVKLTRR